MQICCFPDHRVSNQKANSSGMQSTNFSSSESFNFSSVLFLFPLIWLFKHSIAVTQLYLFFLLFFFFLFFKILFEEVQCSREQYRGVFCHDCWMFLHKWHWVLKAQISDKTAQAKHVMWVRIFRFRSIQNYLWMKTENILAVLSRDVFLYNYCYSCGRWVGQ